MAKKFLIVIIVALIVACVITVMIGFFIAKQIATKVDNDEPKGINITLPHVNDTVSSPLKITGSVNGDGWTGFEGQVGTVRLLDSNGNQLALGILTATADWVKLPTPFETTLWFDYPTDGTGTLVFKNENASGELSRDKTFTLPVRLIKSSSEKTTVKAYFTYVKLNPIYCGAVYPLEREVKKTETPARAALEELLKGPTAKEKNASWSTAINEGVKIQSLTIENGVAKVDFNDQFQAGVAGSCRVTAIRAQLEQTFLQFPTVKSVVISVNGNTGGILQP